MRLCANTIVAFAAGAVLLCVTARAEPEDMTAARKAAAELSAAKGGAELVMTLVATMRNQIIAAITDKSHISHDRAASIFDDILMPEFKRHSSELSTGLQDIYVQNFTVDEMHQQTSFFESPAGKKYLEKTPLIFQEANALGRDWGKRVATEALNKHAQELRDKGLKL